MEVLLDLGGWVIAVLVGVFAFKTKVQFDVNKWLKDRRKLKERKLRMLCPHVMPTTVDDGQLVVQSTYVSPTGTTAWQCQRCGDITHDVYIT